MNEATLSFASGDSSYFSLTFGVQFESGSNTQNVIDDANSENPIIDPQYKNYSFGAMLIGINGLLQSATYYWEFYINNHVSGVGIDGYHPENGDVLSFVYTYYGSSADRTAKSDHADGQESISAALRAHIERYGLK